MTGEQPAPTVPSQNAIMAAAGRFKELLASLLREVSAFSAGRSIRAHRPQCDSPWAMPMSWLCARQCVCASTRMQHLARRKSDFGLIVVRGAEETLGRTGGSYGLLAASKLRRGVHS